MAWQRGRAVLSEPAKWDFLIEEAWDQIIDVPPVVYGLVVRGSRQLALQKR